MTAPKVLSVGQCGIDHPALSRFLRQEFDATVVPADSADDAIDELRRDKYDLVLANRVFDEGGSGMELIATIKGDPALAEVPVMLVSDLLAAQQQAEELGAAPGFGKSELGRPETVTRIAAVLGDGKAGGR
jgi:two-component system chemotaxis response regulator CheY